MPKNSAVYDKLSPRSILRLELLGQRLRNARKRRGWTQQALAEKAGISEGTIKNLEAGSPRVPLAFLVQAMDEFGLAEELDQLVLPDNDSLGAALEAAGSTSATPATAGPDFDLDDAP